MGQFYHLSKKSTRCTESFCSVVFCRSKMSRARDFSRALDALLQNFRQKRSKVFPSQDSFPRVTLHFSFGRKIQRTLPAGQSQPPDGRRSVLPVPGRQTAADGPQLHAVAFQSVGHGVKFPQQPWASGTYFRQVHQFSARRRKMQPHQTATFQFLQLSQQHFCLFHSRFACPDTNIPPFHYFMYDTFFPFPHPCAFGNASGVCVEIRCLFVPEMI